MIDVGENNSARKQRGTGSLVKALETATNNIGQKYNGPEYRYQ